MKAAQINSYGDQNVVKVVDDAVQPVPNSGQVLVAVMAAGVNPFDVTVREGRARQMAELKFPATLGGDLAGKVVSVGEDVSGVSIGDHVYGQANALSGNGSFAEFAPVNSDSIALKPNNVSFEEAAGLPLVSVSAYQAMVDHIDVQPTQKILIHGGAGGIGSIAIQLAKHLGAYVATTASEKSREFVTSLGADECIDYHNQDFSTLIKDYDAVFDMIGGETNVKSYAVLRTGGILVSMVEQPNEELLAQYNIHYIHQFTQVTTDRLTKLAGLVDSDVLKPNIDRVFSLDQAADALAYLEQSHPRGKVVIHIAD